MASASSLLFLLICHVSLLSLAEKVTGFNPRCTQFPCGNLGYLRFPFSNQSNPECGLFQVHKCNQLFQHKIRLGKDGPWFHIADIKQDNTLLLGDHELDFKNHSCGWFQNLTLSNSPFYSFEFPCKPTMFNCTNHSSISTNSEFSCNESNQTIFFYNQTTHDLPSLPAGCSVVQTLVNKTANNVVIHNLHTGGFFLQVNVMKECKHCYSRGGQCLSNSNGKFICSDAKTGNGNKRITLGLGLGIGGTIVLIVAALSIFIKQRRKKGKYASPNLHSRNTSSYPSSKSDMEEGLGVPIFSYSELAEATSNFNHEKELGDGGFGTVYHVDELVDPCLGFHSYEEVKRMATAIAELAFLCLQQNKDMRPAMDVVLEELQRIKSGECKPENLKEEDDDDKEELKSMQQQQQPPLSPPHSEESALLKNIKSPPSPISVTENWVGSNNTTPNASN
ncbi:hypothetical protein ACOSQ4_020029 [Xanthoceras sorbifolium]